MLTILMSFEEIVNTYNIPIKHFFKYLQIRHFILKLQKNSLDMPPLSILEKEVTRNCFSKGLISSLYNMLVSGSKDSSNCKLEAWRSDLKGTVHPKMNSLSSLTHPQVDPNLYECVCSEHKGRYYEESL